MTAMLRGLADLARAAWANDAVLAIGLFAGVVLISGLVALGVIAALEAVGLWEVVPPRSPEPG